MTERYRDPSGFLESGLILRDVKLPEYRRDAEGQVLHSPTDFDWLVVVSQECDLERDRKDRRKKRDDAGFTKESNLLRIVFVCPAFPEERVLSGNYVPGARRWGHRDSALLKKRDGDERYHRLRPFEGRFDQLLVDFKLVTGAHPTYLGSWIDSRPESAVATLVPPFRDRLIQRFVGYLGRIPEPADEEEAEE